MQLERVSDSNEAEEHLHLSERVRQTIMMMVIMIVEKHFRVLEEALYEQKVVRAVYQPGGKTEFIRHILHPYAIFFRRSDWYLEAKIQSIGKHLANFQNPPFPKRYANG